MIQVDLHTHPSPWIFGPETFRSFAEAAASKGIDILGFSEHGPVVDPRFRGVEWNEINRYIEDVQKVKEKYKGVIQIFCGLELDYKPEFLERYANLKANVPFDYFLGSVHVIDDWHVDDSRSLAISKHRHKSEEELYRLYYDRVMSAAKTGIFDSLSHLDYIRRSIPHSPATLPAFARDLFEEIGEALKKSRQIVEVNTRGLRVASIRELQPTFPLLIALIRAGVRFTIGSDAYRADKVGVGLQWGRETLQTMGVGRVVYFKEHRVLEIL